MTASAIVNAPCLHPRTKISLMVTGHKALLPPSPALHVLLGTRPPITLLTVTANSRSPSSGA